MENNIVCADDFGLTKSVNRAIIDVFNKGNLNLTSLMTNMPGTKDAIELAKIHNKLEVGLHFNITEGTSIVGKSSLTDENAIFFSRNKLLKKIFLGQIKKEDVLIEFKEQLNKCYNNNINIKTIDSHQHIHSLNFIFKVILPEIIKRNLTIRSCFAEIRFSLRRFNHLLSNIYLYRNRNNIVFRNSILTSIYHSGKFFNEFDYENSLNKFGNKFKKTELMIHPYIKHQDLKLLYKDTYKIKERFLNNCFHEYEILSKKSVFNLN